MLYRIASLCCSLLLLSSCTNQWLTSEPYNVRAEPAIIALETELSALNRTLQQQATELALLQDRLNEQESISKQRNRDAFPLNTRLNNIEQKISLMEKEEDRTRIELGRSKQIHEEFRAEQSRLKQELISCQQQLAQALRELKSTLTAISQEISQSGTETRSTPPQRYRVQSGDTLEKISKQHDVTIADLKRLNQLRNDTILVGQELILK
jgi:LysM repeat protein